MSQGCWVGVDVTLFRSSHLPTLQAKLSPMQTSSWMVGLRQAFFPMIWEWCGEKEGRCSWRYWKIVKLPNQRHRQYPEWWSLLALILQRSWIGKEWCTNDLNWTRSIYATYTCSISTKSACTTSLLASISHLASFSLRHGDTGDEVRSSLPLLILVISQAKYTKDTQRNTPTASLHPTALKHKSLSCVSLAN